MSEEIIAGFLSLGILLCMVAWVPFLELLQHVVRRLRQRRIAAAWLSALTVSAALAVGFPQLARASDDRPDSSDGWAIAHARIVAVGIPGAGAVAEVGDF